MHELKHDVRIDTAVTLSAAIWLVTSEVLKPDLVPEKCRWCARAEDGKSSLNGYDGWVRDRLVWHSPSTADSVSNWVAFGIMPTGAIAGLALSAQAQNAADGAPIDTLVVTEAAVLAIALNQLTKFVFARERPFVHFLPRVGEVPGVTESPSDDNLSFFSGHTTLAFALATASGTVASLRGYHTAPFVWGGGLILASSVGYLRIAADKHYLTDVLTGVVAGSAVGFVVPTLFHGRTSSTDTTVQPGSAMPPAAIPLSIQGSW